MSVTVKVPATSANLGPGFDALGLALDRYLTVTAEPAETVSVSATGRDAVACGRQENNLILKVIAQCLQGSPAQNLKVKLHVENDIPLGKGCGSSAAAIVAGVMLANELGNLGWNQQRILEEVSRIEGHPDNVAAAVLGGLVCSAMSADGAVNAVRVSTKADWKFLLAIPDSALSTKKARGMLPDSYSKADTIQNVQHVAMLVGAFAEGRGDLLHIAMQDRMHQPYRMEACPLLKELLPLSGQDGILGVALSGAGPSVLLVVESSANRHDIDKKVIDQAGNLQPELLQMQLAEGAVAFKR